MPVVAVDNLRVPFKDFEEFYHGFGEKQVTLQVLVIGIYASPCEIAGVFHQVNGDVTEFSLFYPGRLPAVHDVNVETVYHRGGGEFSFVNDAIFGEDQTHIVPKLVQGFGKGADDIGQSANFG